MKWVFGTIIAITVLCAGIVVFAYWTALGAENPVGFQITRAADADGRGFAVGVWYPSESRGLPTTQIGTVLMQVARDAPVKGAAHPLVVISHGNGGGMQGHADLALALASAGYVVAAPMHPGDNFMDQSASGTATLYSDRNRQLRATIDHMLFQWKDHGFIDADRVGAFGFSAGGFTVLTIAGAQPDMSLIAKHCMQAPEFICDVLAHYNSPLLKSGGPLGDPMRASPQIKAIVVAAPGLGFTLNPQTLAAVQVPVQLWSGDKDDKVPYATNAKIIKEGLGRQMEAHTVPGAGHVSFLAPCGLLRPVEVCMDPEGFDRKAFHADMNAQVVQFFNQNLNRL